MIPAVTCVRRHSMYSGSFKSPRVLYGDRFFETGPASSIGDMRVKVYAVLTDPVFPVELGCVTGRTGGVTGPTGRRQGCSPG